MTNPLFQYFRQPGIHIKLPSKGYYNDSSEMALESSGEVAVYPMTGADEIMLTNPDALLNGSALERIIASCCPAVKNPKNLPIPDVDVIILASKLVSYGEGLNLIVKCPSCQIAKEFTLSIRDLLEQITYLPDQTTVRLNDDLVVYLKPYTLDSNNKLNLAQFEETKIIQNLVNEDISETDRSRALSLAFEKISQLNLDLLSNSVMIVAMPDSTVTDQKDIREFIDNSDRKTVKLLKEGLASFNQYGLPKTTELTCDNAKCGKSWQTPIVYDPSSFFVSNS